MQAEVFPDEWLQLNRKSRIPIRAYSAEQRKWLSEFKTSSHCTRCTLLDRVQRRRSFWQSLQNELGKLTTFAAVGNPQMYAMRRATQGSINRSSADLSLALQRVLKPMIGVRVDLHRRRAPVRS